MACFAVSYQLNKKKDYQPLWDELDKLDAHKVMNSFYFVELNNTTQEVRDHLKPFTDDDDYLCVVRFQHKPAFTKARGGTNDWINSRF